MPSVIFDRGKGSVASSTLSAPSDSPTVHDDGRSNVQNVCRTGKSPSVGDSKRIRPARSASAATPRKMTSTRCRTSADARRRRQTPSPIGLAASGMSSTDALDQFAAAGQAEIEFFDAARFEIERRRAAPCSIGLPRQRHVGRAEQSSTGGAAACFGGTFGRLCSASRDLVERPLCASFARFDLAMTTTAAAAELHPRRSS